MTEPEFHEETPEEFARQPDRDLHGVPTPASGESDSGTGDTGSDDTGDADDGTDGDDGPAEGAHSRQ